MAVYGVLDTLLTLVGGGMPKGVGWKKVVKIAEGAVEDVLKPYTAVREDNTIIANSSASTSGKRKKGGSGASINLKNSTATATLADALLNTAASSTADTQSQQPHTHPSSESKVAIAFLGTLLTRLPAQRIPSELRTKIDRMAILTNTRELLLASVLFPAGYVRGSLLPFLVAGKARGGVEELGVQGVCWPRMPVVRVGEDVEEEGEEEEEEDEEDEEGTMDVDVDALHNVDSRGDAIDGNAEPLSREEKWSRALRTPTSTQVIPPAPPSPPPPQSQHQPPAPPPTTPAKPTPPSNNDIQDTTHVLPALTPSAKQLHQDMQRAAALGPETPHPTKRVKLSPPATTSSAAVVSETIVVRGSIGTAAGGGGGAGMLGGEDDDEGEMVIPEIDFGRDSDEDDDSDEDGEEGSEEEEEEEEEEDISRW